MALTPPMAPPPPPPYRKANYSPFYYGLVAIASTAILLMIYNIIIVGWCCQHRRERARRRFDRSAPGEASSSFENPDIRLIPVYKYRKNDGLAQNSGNECAVCLSAFVDGEEIRQLPECKHSFHVPCIDMWLYSHSNCPLCRAGVAAPPLLFRIPVTEEDDIRGGPPGPVSSA